MTPGSPEKNWASRGFSCGIWTDPPGQVWEDFVHDSDELVMLIEGEVELEVDGEVQMLSPGREVLIPSGACHSVRNKGNVKSRWYYGYRR